MALDENSPLDRATRAMRDQSPAGWIELSGSIRDAISSTVRRGVDLPADPGPTDVGSTVKVADRVLRLALRDALNNGTRSLANARVQMDHDELSRLRLELVCLYGTDLQAEADAARGVARQVLTATLGSADGIAVDIEIIDVEDT